MWIRIRIAGFSDEATHRASRNFKHLRKPCVRGPLDRIASLLQKAAWDKEDGMRVIGTALGAILALTAAPAAAQIEQAEVSGGSVSGEVVDGLSIFKGIPFAAPPTGDLRWKAPLPVVPWFGVKQTTEFADACMQDFDMLRTMGSQRPMSEDCLYLDVWTPAQSPDEKRPVIVWIYGGGFTGGATSIGLYDGANFARKGVVFVSLSYRLGSLGFLATPGLSAESGQGSGNYAMLDMVQGLEWVRDNITHFGGDPEQVTIMGHSAGSMAASVLNASPLAQGLIDGVIAESGVNFGPVQVEPIAAGGPFVLSVAEQRGADWLLGLGAQTPDEARGIPAAMLLAAQSESGAPPWRPVVDGHVLTGDQWQLWQEGNFNDVPLLVGTTSNEWGASRDNSGDDFVASVQSGYGAHADRILAAYPHATEAERAQSSRWLANESGMESGAFLNAKAQQAHGERPAYYYWFNNAEGGSGHGSEVALVFGNEDMRPGRTPWDDRTRALSEQMQSYWVNFASTGNPNGDGLDQWPAFDPDSSSVMALGLETKVIDVPGRERLEALADYFAWRRVN
jgi:para-nitrobenzyl esterase